MFILSFKKVALLLNNYGINVYITLRNSSQLLNIYADDQSIYLDYNQNNKTVKEKNDNKFKKCNVSQMTKK